MSENLNINVLVAAKEEYTKQLVYTLSPEIYSVILNVYIDSQKLKKKTTISLRNFQLELKKIQLWNTIVVQKHTKNIKTKIPYLLNLITAIFVSHVKILACVRLKTHSKNINVKVPDLDHFLHQIIIMNAEKIYYNPSLILKKKEQVIIIISETIEETIRNQIPIDEILTEYLAGVFQEDQDEENNDRVINDKEFKNISSDIDAEIDSEIDSEIDTEIEDIIKEDDNNIDEHEDSDDELSEQKSIIPTRPLPQMQFGNEINQSDIKTELEFPTTEIKKPTFFTDAKDKNKFSDNIDEDSDVGIHSSSDENE